MTSWTRQQIFTIYIALYCPISQEVQIIRQENENHEKTFSGSYTRSGKETISPEPFKKSELSISLAQQ